jgi:hypothetical protein
MVEGFPLSGQYLKMSFVLFRFILLNFSLIVAVFGVLLDCLHSRVTIGFQAAQVVFLFYLMRKVM